MKVGKRFSIKGIYLKRWLSQIQKLFLYLVRNRIHMFYGTNIQFNNFNILLVLKMFSLFGFAM